ncbi:MAG: nuclear transport factor 2 family protein [Bacteroidales bacterium]|nr:nuclear transport factor 2 family protein [Bacteroidales bacterium]
MEAEIIIAIIGAVGVISVAIITTRRGKNMSKEKETVHEFVKSINEHNVNKIYDLMDNDFRFIDAYGSEETGKEHMRESWIGYFRWFPDYKIEIIDLFSDSNILVILGFASGTYQNKKAANDENHWRLPAAWKIVVSENKIKQWQVYCDSKIPFDIIERNNENASR